MQYSKLGTYATACLAALMRLTAYANEKGPYITIGGTVDCRHLQPNELKTVVGKNIREITKRERERFGQKVLFNFLSDGNVEYIVYFFDPTKVRHDVAKDAAIVHRIIQTELCPRTS